MLGSRHSDYKSGWAQMVTIAHTASADGGNCKRMLAAFFHKSKCLQEMGD